MRVGKTALKNGDFNIGKGRSVHEIERSPTVPGCEHDLWDF